MPLTPLSGTLGPKRAAHLLRRAAFGGTKAQIDTFSGYTVGQAMNVLFQTGLPDPAVPLDTATGQEWVLSGAIEDVNSEESTLQEYFKRWFIGQMFAPGVPANQQLAYSVREHITFWMHTFFTTKQSKVNSSRALYFQNALFRFFAFDDTLTAGLNFKSLSKKICVDNAMLIFLDGRQNVRGSVNENFGRELFELYSIGRGLEGTLPPAVEQGDYFTFTEQDVRAAAAVLSGFDNDNTYSELDPDTGLPRGVAKGTTIASQHTSGDKQFSNYFTAFNGGMVSPDPLLELNGEPTEESALDEIDQLIEMIYSRQETVRAICRKLYRFFAYYEIDQTLDDSIINDMATTFINNDYRIQPVLEELFSSEHFYEAVAGNQDDKFGGIIKSPLDLAVGTLKFFEVAPPDPQTDIGNFYQFTGSIINSMGGQGLDFYEPFEVAGYSAFHQFPIYHRAWISTNYLTNRYSWIQNIITSMMEPGMINVDVLAFVRANIANATAQDARQLIIEMVSYLFPLSDNLTYDPMADDNSSLTAERMNYFLQAFLFDPQIDPDPEASWTFRWNNGVDDEVLQNQLENLINALLQSPEYQLL